MTHKQISDIVHKNYLLTQAVHGMRLCTWGIRLAKNSKNETIVQFQKDSTVKATIGPAKWLDENGKAHIWKVEGHPEFDSLVDTFMYLTEGNVMSPEFAWHEKCMNPSLDYLKAIWPEYVFRAYAFDTIIENFKYGLMYKRDKSSDFYEALHEAELNIAPYILRNEKEIVKQFMRLHASGALAA